VLPLLLVCLGGALGSGARFLVATGAARTFGTGFPVGTAIVNLAGSFLLGAIAAAAGRGLIGEPARVFLGAGLMGGFTTYSSFNWETLILLDGRRRLAAAANVALTLGGCLAAAALGAALLGGLRLR
jgi:CrcB protein